LKGGFFVPLGYEYKRYFIILQEEDKGYERTAGKIPTGYVKIEIKKNKVKVVGFIQNMKSDTKSQYKLNLLAPGKKLVLDIGSYRMDGTGRGEFYSEFDSDNVSGSNLAIDEFTGALVVAGSAIPLVGYTGRDSIPWRDWYGKEVNSQEVAYIEEIEEKEEIRETVEAEEIREAEIVEEIEEEIEEAREAEVVDEPIEVYDEFEIQAVEDIEMRVEPAPLYYEEPEYTKRQSFHDWDTSILAKEPEESIRHKKEQNESENKINRKLINVLREMERFDGFHDEYGFRWYRVGQKVPLLNDIIIPLNGAMMPLSYPYIMESSSGNIENCVLGVEHRKGEIKYVYIGIPGVYNNGCKVCFEYKGFTGYRRTKDNRRGYWVMCIDIINGRICRI